MGTPHNSLRVCAVAHRALGWSVITRITRPCHTPGISGCLEADPTRASLLLMELSDEAHLAR